MSATDERAVGLDIINPSRPLRSFVAVMPRSWKYRLLLLGGGLGYWLLYAFSSSGMFQFVNLNVIPILREEGLSNPYFVGGFRSPFDIYYSGLIWFPNGHIQVTLLLGTVIFSIVLSILFGLNIFLIVHSFKLRHARAQANKKNANARKNGTNKKLGFSGFLGMIPALFSSGMPCCSVPLGTFLLSALLPSSAALVTTAAFRYTFLINLVTMILMLIPLIYLPRKL